AHIAELVGATAAEVLGTCTFYEMFKMKPVGKFLINVCGTMRCALRGAADVIHRAEQVLGIRVGDTTDDGLFTLEQAECQAACTEAPCLQVNYRYRYRVTPGQVEVLIDDLRTGRLDDEIPPHGTVAKVRQRIPADRAVGAVPPDEVTGAPAWMQGAAQ
ncbi:MAG: NAD(P)H-dependent oxidoreductase subunit E, partial [Gemmatimonadota bacterium]